jgi:hypothetical protein
VIASAQTIQYGVSTGQINGAVQGPILRWRYRLHLGAEVVLLEWHSSWGLAKLVNGTYESYQSWAVASDIALMYEGASGPKYALIIKNLPVLNSPPLAAPTNPCPTNVLFAVGDKLAHAPFRWTFVIRPTPTPKLGLRRSKLVSVDPVTGATTQLDMSTSQPGAPPR